MCITVKERRLNTQKCINSQVQPWVWDNSIYFVQSNTELRIMEDHFFSQPELHQGWLSIHCTMTKSETSVKVLKTQHNGSWKPGCAHSLQSPPQNHSSGPWCYSAQTVYDPKDLYVSKEAVMACMNLENFIFCISVQNWFVI